MPQEQTRRSEIPSFTAGQKSKVAPLRILVAEDHPVCRQVLGLVLEQYGVAPTLVADGRQALVEWRRSRFDALMLDIDMPGLTGLDVTRAVRADEGAPSRTPIIIVSADFRPERIAECVEAGADIHLAKPVTAAVVASALTSVLGRADLAEA